MNTPKIDSDTSNAAGLNTPSFDIPTEIIELIGGYADNTSLLALSLVNHDLLRLSRRRFFSSIKISTNKRLRKAGARWDDFLDLLESPYQTFAIFIKSLLIFGLSTYRDDDYLVKARPHARSLGRQLLNMRILRIVSIRWKNITPDTLAFLTAIPAQKIWILESCLEESNSGQLLAYTWEILSNMPRDCQIYLCDNTCSNPVSMDDLSSLSDVFTHPMHFTLLDINLLAHMQPVWDPEIVSSISRIISIETLYVSKMWKYDQMSFIRRFLKQVGHSLKRLLIGLDYNGAVDFLFDPLEGLFDSSAIANLTEIHIGPLEEWCLHRLPCHDLRSILLRVPTTGIQVLGLLFEAGAMRRDFIARLIENYPWGRVITELIETIPSLTQLKITFLISSDIYDETHVVDAAQEVLDFILEKLAEGMPPQTKLGVDFNISEALPSSPRKDKWWEVI